MEYYGDILKKKEICMYKIASLVFWFFVKLYTPSNIKTIKTPRIMFIGRSKEYHLFEGMRFEDPTVTEMNNSNKSAFPLLQFIS